MQSQTMTQLGSRRIAGASRPVIGRNVQSARTGLTARSPAVQSNKPILLQQRKISASEFLRAVVAHSETASTASFGARVNPTSAMNIVFVAAEVAPWSKTGGLGDVVGGLPIELAKRGHHVITIAPRYDQYYDGWDTSVVVNIMGEQVRYFHAIKKGVHRVFIDHPVFLAKVWGKTGSKLYGPRSGADFVDNQKRFSLFCKAAIEAVRVLPFGPGEDCVFVANDWHSAMVPVLIKEVYQPKGEFKNTKVAFCIHNIAFQGRFFAENFKDLGLPASALEKFAFSDGHPTIYDETNPLDDDVKLKEAPSGGKLYKKLNWMKAAALTSDKIITVSPNYAAEITSNPQKGVELDHIIRAAGGAEGIVNGMDIEEWNPKKDKFLDVPYDKTTVFTGKAAAKAALQAELGLPVSPSTPLIGYIGRLEEQKGVDIMMAAIPKIAQSGAQVAILGTGKAQYEKMVNSLSAKFPGIAKGTVKFSATLAHLITAGADFILVPSRFEPCGLIQLHAMQYGTVPIVASTGGLVDTVKEGITGFHMGALDPDELVPSDVDAIALTVSRAVDVYKTPMFKQMVVNCIGQDLSWSKPALKWEGMLEELTIASPEGKNKKNSIATPVATPLTQKAPALAGAAQ